MKVTLLKADQIWGQNSLDCMQKYGTISSASDLAIILGCEVYQDVSTIDGLPRSCQSVTSSYYEKVFKSK